MMIPMMMATPSRRPTSFFILTIEEIEEEGEDIILPISFMFKPVENHTH